MVYDGEYVIAGAGLSGLLMAKQLVDAPDLDGRIVLIDSSFDRAPARTWCFWGEIPEFLAPYVEKTWRHMTVASSTERVTRRLDREPYHMIRAETFCTGLLNELEAHPQVRFLRGRVEDMFDTPDGALTRVDGRVVSSRWLFQSVRAPRLERPLLQHFGGWEVETSRPIFDAESVTLMDFDLPRGSEEGGATSFMYVVPTTPHRALVEFTEISHRRRPRSFYDRHLASYLGRWTDEWRYLRTEYGAIPMDASEVPQRTGQHIFHLGRAGGMTKPSSGYTLRRTVDQVESLVRGLSKHGVPRVRTRSKMRHRFLDRLFLKVLTNRPELGATLFTNLFFRNRFDTVLSFLGEKTSLWDEAKLVSSLPKAPFLEELVGASPRTISPGVRLALPGPSRLKRRAT
ncbi:MAG: lycopene cyclase family protein [Myxococcota bacterium]